MMGGGDMGSGDDGRGCGRWWRGDVGDGREGM